MKVVQINTFPHKATGRIMLGIHDLLRSEQHESYVAWGRGRSSANNTELVIDDRFGMLLHGLLFSRVLGKTGHGSINATKTLISHLKEIEPDIIHLHNIHGYYLNIEYMMSYIKSNEVKVVWTFHDCWPFTGQCAYFDRVACEKWKTGCYDCEQLNEYPRSLFDSSKYNWRLKKELFSNINGVIVTPSVWLKNLVKESFLGQTDVRVIRNGIQTNIFKSDNPLEKKKKIGLSNKHIVLGVASEWTKRKGLNDFIKLNEKLREYDIFKFVLIGLSKKQKSDLPKDMVGLERTENAKELADYYSIASIFYNPTYEDNFPTTNIESLACGTPVLTYDTGGSAEVIEQAANTVIVGWIHKKEGKVQVDIDKIGDLLLRLIARKEFFDERTIFKSDALITNCQLIGKQYNTNDKLSEYIEVYSELLKEDFV